MSGYTLIQTLRHAFYVHAFKTHLVELQQWIQDPTVHTNRVEYYTDNQLTSILAKVNQVIMILNAFHFVPNPLPLVTFDHTSNFTTADQTLIMECVMKAIATFNSFHFTDTDINVSSSTIDTIMTQLNQLIAACNGLHFTDPISAV